jgi:hypothetical protein
LPDWGRGEPKLAQNWQTLAEARLAYAESGLLIPRARTNEFAVRDLSTQPSSIRLMELRPVFSSGRAGDWRVEDVIFLWPCPSIVQAFRG